LKAKNQWRNGVIESYRKRRKSKTGGGESIMAGGMLEAKGYRKA